MTESVFGLRFAPSRKLSDTLGENRTGDGADVVEVRDAFAWQALGAAEREFHRDVPDGGRDLNGEKLAQVRIGAVPAEQQNGTPSGRFRKGRPPDLVLSHAFHAPAFDQLSA